VGMVDFQRESWYWVAKETVRANARRTQSLFLMAVWIVSGCVGIVGISRLQQQLRSGNPGLGGLQGSHLVRMYIS